MRHLFAHARFIVFICAIGMISAVNAPSFATTPVASEHTLIAAFLYNFLKFTEWPDGTINDEMTLCTSKNSALEELDAITGRIAQSKPVRIKHTILNESLHDCQLLFLLRDEGEEHIREWLKTTEGKPILIISNTHKFLDMGGMIALINDGKNLNFAVNLERVRYAGLKLNAQLLQIAREVRGR